MADLPVWIEVGIVCFFFLLLGTHEEIYLAIYAAGVFILLSMTGWAATKRLVRRAQASPSAKNIPLILGTIIAASLTSGATIVIFAERFWEGAWTYFIFIPALYAAFTYFRNRYGDPTPEMDYLGQLDAAQLAGFGFGQVAKVPILPGQQILSNHVEVAWHPDHHDQKTWFGQVVSIPNIIVLLDGSDNAAHAIPIARAIAQKLNAKITLLSAIKKRPRSSQSQLQKASTERMFYLNSVVADLASTGVNAEAVVEIGSIFDISEMLIQKNGFGLVITSTRGGSGEHNWLRGGLSHKLVEKIDTPVLPIPVDDSRILVALDGSTYSERTLLYTRLLAKAFNSQVVLLCVSAIPEEADYRAPADIVLKIRRKAEANMYKFLAGSARLLRRGGLKVDVRVTGSIPSHAILAVAEEEKVDMLMLTSQGRGGYNALLLGSVAEYVVQNTKCPVFMVPIQVESKAPDTISGN